MKNKFKSNQLKLASTDRLEKENTMYYNLGIVVRWDTKKAELNVKKHGITFEEAATVLFADCTLELEDPRHN